MTSMVEQRNHNPLVSGSQNSMVFRKMSIIIQEIAFGTPLYESSKELREKVLRRPLQLELSHTDLQGEEGQIHIAVVQNSTNVLGTVLLKPLNENDVKLRQMAVDNSLQGQGYGRALIEFAECLAAQRHFKRIEMHARLSALNFYKKLGYGIVGESFIEVTVPTIQMVKNLDAVSH
jgi:predicted GNAT family N-acyltransferase